MENMESAIGRKLWMHLYRLVTTIILVSTLLCSLADGSLIDLEYPRIFTLRGKSVDINSFIHKFDVLRRDRRETHAQTLETTRVLITSAREARSLEVNVRGTPVAISERRFNLTACLEAQNRWKRTAHFDYERYHQLYEIHDWMAEIARNHPEKVTVFDITRSFEGRPLKTFKISSGGGPKPAVWVDGGIHAREWISPATVIYFVRTMLENYSSNSTIKWMVDNYDWYILPVFNVDGYVYSWEQDRMWRKTRSTQENTDCVGADPNRNWDYHWGSWASSDDPCSDSYKGRHAFSEVEVKEVANFIKSHKEIKMYLTYHNAGQKYIIPWGYTPDKVPDHDYLMRLCKKGIGAVEAVNGQPYTCNSVTNYFGVLPGVSNDYIYGALNIKYSFAVELRDRTESSYHQVYYFCLPEDQIADTARENFAGLVKLLQEAGIEPLNPAEDIHDTDEHIQNTNHAPGVRFSLLSIFIYFCSAFGWL